MKFLRPILLAASVALIADARASVTIAWVTVGDAGNSADPTTGYGAVAYEYQIGKYEVTNAEYTAFLNAVDPEGANANDIYNTGMGSERSGGITYTAGSASGGKYTIKSNMGDRPVIYVSWYDGARFTNWMHNGQPLATASSADPGTETGAYTLNGAYENEVILKNPVAKYWIPSEDEWYKAAYYDPQKSFPNTPGYWKYATQSDTLPDDTRGGFTVANAANYNDTGARNNKLTDVGSYVNSPSHYGTFDQTGNLWEWNDAIFMTPSTGKPDSRGVRGGSWSQGILAVENLTLRDYPDGYRAPDGYLFYSDDDTGFRLAGVMPAPLGVTPPA